MPGSSVTLATLLAGALFASPPSGAAGEVLELPPAQDASADAPDAESEPAPEPPPEAEPAAEAARVPAPELVEDPAPARARRVNRCLPEVEPCYHTTRGRLLLGGLGLATTGLALGLSLFGSDRNRIGDPAMAMTAGGIIAMTAATFGGVVALARGDGPAIPDRITPATVALALDLGGSAVSDERLPAKLAARFAPTWQFPRDLGRLRLLAGVGGSLGTQLERDPRPQTQTEAGGFEQALTRRGLGFDLGLDLALRLPYPITPRARAGLGQFELRYKPQVWFARDRYELGAGAEGDALRVSERVLLAPLTFGLRWHLSPRQRFTFYMGPRWDIVEHGEPGELAGSKPMLAPIYSESWFDLDFPIWLLPRARRATVLGQLNLGYIHSRSFGGGLDFGAVVGFFGQVVAQLGFRVRPLGSPVAYQLELGANFGQGLAPFVRVGLVLPDIGGSR